MHGYSSFIATFIIFFFKFGRIITQTDSYIIPEPTFTVLPSNRLKVSIPHKSGMHFFAFHGNVNKEILVNQIGDISGETYMNKKKKWTILNKNTILEDGDYIYYWMQIQFDGQMYTKSDRKRITINDEKISVLLFNEDFNIINSSIWERDVRIPLSPDYEFCVYHDVTHESLLRTIDGHADFRPILLEDKEGDRFPAYGTLKLRGCTSKLRDECSRNATAYNILPPVLSARLTTKKSFNFRYGRIEIRAKFPQGDWLYPEMYLESAPNPYGSRYESGRVILGLARGNIYLFDNRRNLVFDWRKLEFGVLLGTNANRNNYTVSKVNMLGPYWTEDFHNYTTIWYKNGFKFYVDNELVGNILPEEDGWLERDIYDKMAPFNREFYISIGLGVGGIRVFPDDIGHSMKKPWRNVGAKAMLQFWQAKDDWLKSWNAGGKKPSFKIDYIRVWSV